MNEVKQKIAIVSNPDRDALSTKLESIFKRKYTITMLQTNNNSHHYNYINILDTEYVKAYFIAHKVDIFMLTNDIVIDYLTYNQELLCEALDDIAHFCANAQIRIVLLNPKYVFHTTQSGYIFLGYQNDIFAALRQNITDCFSKFSDNLVVNFDTFYGINDVVYGDDFPEYAYHAIASGNDIDLSDSFILTPLLSDEVCIFVMDNFSDTGQLAIQTDIPAVSVKKWIECILHIRQRLSEHTDFESEYMDSQRKKFSGIERGYITELKQKKCGFNLVYRLDPIDHFFNKRIADARLYLGESLAQSIPKDVISQVDYVVPVPKTGMYYAMGLACATHLPYIQALSKDNTRVRTFQILDVDIRKQLIHNKITPIKELISGKNLLIVDEAIFTGTTLKVVCQVLRDNGAAKIFIGIPTPQCHHKCPYYVLPNRSMLLETIDYSDLIDYFDVDGVYFQDSAYFTELFADIGDSCIWCFCDKGVSE